MNGVRDLYVCIYPVDARERLQEDLERLYRGGEGRGWLVANPKPGRFYAAPYEREGYHRVLLRKMVSNSSAELFYVDFGTIAVVSLSKLRLLHIDFLQPPAMAIQVRLWGLRGGGKRKLLQELSQGNRREGDLLARVEVAGDRPAIWLMDNTVPGGKSLNLHLVKEGSSKWRLPDLEKMSAVKGVFGTEEEPEHGRGSMTDLEGLIEVQTALVNLMLESDLKTELMGKLMEAKQNLVDFSKSSLERVIIDADLGIGEPELESCSGESYVPSKVESTRTEDSDEEAPDNFIKVAEVLAEKYTKDEDSKHKSSTTGSALGDDVVITKRARLVRKR